CENHRVSWHPIHGYQVTAQETGRSCTNCRYETPSIRLRACKSDVAQVLEHIENVQICTPDFVGRFFIDPAEQFARDLPLSGVFQFRQRSSKANKQFQVIFSDQRGWVA
ncbi:MAG: hypothetical protein JAY64_00525, partial [Candidatus Thiodiazotropha weberae]|nr:hypothetical protein [Candidatus Thiodiazotropha lotti]MCW4209633.1 hypothetical protein [Candidatus Thiodiazotropha lotti]